MPIEKLDHETATKIAAGEVITSPAAVVKELVENSIDAGSSRIDLRIVDGGKREITVTDNGSGIRSDEIHLAFDRHATSKIHKLEDLYELGSLGFRGEALPSIAAVSKVSVKTQSEGEDLGSHAKVDGENIGIVRRSFSRGTSISVEDLFYNTPARLKHMKKSSELSREVIELSENLALSHPDITFSLVVDKKTVMKTPGDDNLLNCIYSIFGSAFGDALMAISYENKPMAITGFLGKPNYTKSNRKDQYLFVNNRYVREPKISRAIEEAYENAIMINQHPVFVLNIQIPPHMLDVNVHPSKTRIKILNESLILLLIKDGIRKTLRDSSQVKEIALKTEKVTLDEKNYVQEDMRPIIQSKPEPKEGVREETQIEKGADPISPVKYDKKSQGQEDAPIEQVDRVEEPRSNQDFAEQFQNTRVVGQLFNTYILFEGDDYILLMDQHAAHERVLFEDLTKKVKNGETHTQQTMPSTIKLSPSDYALLMDNKEIFTNIGFEFDEFGDNTICIRGVPIFSNKVQNSSLLMDILGEIDQKVDIKTVTSFQEIVIQTACKKAIKANKRLSPQEVSALTDSLMACDYPYTCPHGRPILAKLTKYEFEKLFKRIQ